MIALASCAGVFEMKLTCRTAAADQPRTGTYPWRMSLSEKELQHEAGFNLLELMLVIVIMGFAVAVSYPALSRGTAAFHLRATGREILNTLRYAREKAITEQKSMLVTVDRETQRVILSDEVGDGARSYYPPRDVRIQQVFLAGQELREEPLTIRFMTNGSCEIAEILLMSDKGGVLKVVTDPLTGGARVQTTQGENVP
jgi:prepilin-type N-terminal cleavage/methylation domain-containing protein